MCSGWRAGGGLMRKTELVMSAQDVSGYFVLSAITGQENADVNATTTFPIEDVRQLREPG